MMVVRSFIRKIHLWLSIPFGIFLIVSLLTGAVLVFEKDIVSSADNGGIVSSIGWNNPQPFLSLLCNYTVGYLIVRKAELI